MSQHVPEKLAVGQAWDDDYHGTQRVITAISVTGTRVRYKVEVRHPIRGVEWVERECFVRSFWAWVHKTRAHVR